MCSDVMRHDKSRLMVHRTAKLLPYLPSIVFGLILMLDIGMRGGAVGPWDQFAGDTSRGWDVLAADGMLQFAPWRSLVFEGWSQHLLPTWNSYILGGTPLLANSQSAALYLPHIAMGVLGFGWQWGMLVLAGAHLIVAGCGVTFCALRLGGSRVFASLAGLGFAGSSFMVAWTALPSVPSTVAWVPWALGFLVGLHREERRIDRVGLAVSVACIVFSGHLQFVAYGFLALAFVWLWLTVTQLEWRRSFTSALCIALGVGLSAPHLLPVLDYGKHSHRQNVANAEGYAAYNALSLKPYEFAGLFIPQSLGDPRQQMEVEGVGRIVEFLPALRKPGANFAESSFGLGAVLLGLLIAGRRRLTDPVAGAFAGVAVLGLLLAVGSSLTQAMYFLVPGWSATGSPARAGVLFLLGLAIFAGSRNPEEGISREVKVRGIVVTVVFLSLGFGIGGGLSPLALVLVGLAVLLGVLLVQRVQKGLLVWAVAGLAVLAATFRMTPAGHPMEFPQSSPERRIAVVQDRWSLYTRPNAPLPPNLLTLARTPQLSGYDSLIHADTAKLFEALNGGRTSPPENGNMMLTMSSADPALLAQYGVAEVWRPLADGTVDRSPVAKAWYWKTDTDSGLDASRSVQGLSLSVKGGGTLQVRERFMDGWSATVDGKPMTVSADGAWMRIEGVPSGDHEVALTYLPPKLVTGWWLAVVSLLGVAVLTLTGSRASRTGALPDENPSADEHSL